MKKSLFSVFLLTLFIFLGGCSNSAATGKISFNFGNDFSEKIIECCSFYASEGFSREDSLVDVVVVTKGDYESSQVFNFASEAEVNGSQIVIDSLPLGAKINLSLSVKEGGITYYYGSTDVEILNLENTVTLSLKPTMELLASYDGKTFYKSGDVIPYKIYELTFYFQCGEEMENFKGEAWLNYDFNHPLNFNGKDHYLYTSVTAMDNVMELYRNGENTVSFNVNNGVFEKELNFAFSYEEEVVYDSSYNLKDFIEKADEGDIITLKGTFEDITSVPVTKDIAIKAADGESAEIKRGSGYDEASGYSMFSSGIPYYKNPQPLPQVYLFGGNDSSLIIDGNGARYSGPAFYIFDKCSLTVYDNVFFSNILSNSTSQGAALTNSGNLILKGGDFDRSNLNSITNDSRNGQIYTYHGIKLGGNVYVAGSIASNNGTTTASLSYDIDKSSWDPETDPITIISTLTGHSEKEPFVIKLADYQSVIGEQILVAGSDEVNLSEECKKFTMYEPGYYIDEEGRLQTN